MDWNQYFFVHNNIVSFWCCLVTVPSSRYLGGLLGSDWIKIIWWNSLVWIVWITWRCGTLVSMPSCTKLPHLYINDLCIGCGLVPGVFKYCKKRKIEQFMLIRNIKYSWDIFSLYMYLIKVYVRHSQYDLNMIMGTFMWVN